MRRPRKNNDKRRAVRRRLLGVQLDAFFYTRTLMALGTALLLLVALSTRLVPERVSLKLGQQATEFIRAPRSVTYVDSQATEQAREAARKGVADQYAGLPEASNLAQQTVKDIFRLAEQVRADEALGADTQARVAALRDLLDVPLSDTTLRLLVVADEGALNRARSEALRLVSQNMQKPIRSATEDLDDARKAVQAEARNLALTPKYQALVAEIASRALRPNLRYDEQTTNTLRNNAAAAVEPVQQQVQAGEVIIAPGQQVTQRHLDIVEALGLMHPRPDYSQGAAVLALLLLMVTLLGAYLARFAPEVYRSDRKLLLVCLVLVAAAAGYRFAQGSAFHGAVVLAVSTAMAMMISTLLSPRVALALSAYLGLLAGMSATPADARLMAATILVGIYASYALSAATNMTTAIARAAGGVAVVNALVFAITGEVFGLTLSWQQLTATAVGGLLSTSLAVVLIMAMERSVGVVTHLRLLELSNPNQPLLHRLLTEAPGSYQSSVMVANLAEAAAEEIGANALLVRAGAMYHDIGKLKRPYFFIENQFGGDNPHAKLKPRLSALTLIAHVRDGYELAREAGLPPQIADIIREHHGTSLAAYPYHLAVQEDGEDKVNEADYRYPGPKPSTREAGLIMLADAVEAAARTLVNPDRETLEELVERIVAAKVQDGQLDQCPLTFAELNAVKRSLVNSLVGMFHQRIRYPDQLVAEEPQPRQPRRADDRVLVGAGDTRGHADRTA